MLEFDPPVFRSHPLIRGGHLQTIFSIRLQAAVTTATQQHFVRLPDGDAIVLHDDRPDSWQVGDAALVLVHGLAGCHGSSYMIRLAKLFCDLGVRVFRMDMRGCGAGKSAARHLPHAGRCDDLIEALSFVAQQTQTGPLGVIGISMGGNQLLRAVGRIEAGLRSRPGWFDRLQRVAAVAPPLDLKRCSDNMQRKMLRLYNRYFIRLLLRRVPDRVRQREDFQLALRRGRPRTLRELDNQFTAPLSGFRDAADYYHQCSAMHVTDKITVPTLILAAVDDPMVPIGSFTDRPTMFSESTRLLISPGGGHVGFITPQRRCWMDHVLAEWYAAFSLRQ